MADLEEAIKVSREAVEATPPDHLNRAMYLNNLGNNLGNKFSRIGVMADLEKAIIASQEAVKATPQDHTNRVTRTGAMADLEEAKQISSPLWVTLMLL